MFRNRVECVFKFSRGINRVGLKDPRVLYGTNIYTFIVFIPSGQEVSNLYYISLKALIKVKSKYSSKFKINICSTSINKFMLTTIFKINGNATSFIFNYLYITRGEHWSKNGPDRTGPDWTGQD